MDCPACGERLPPASASCAACGALVAPGSEGSLAPDPALTPPSQASDGRIVEIPALRKREPTWKDEVRERVRHRRRRRTEPSALPLFGDGEAEADPSASAPTDAAQATFEPATPPQPEAVFEPPPLPGPSTPEDRSEPSIPDVLDLPLRVASQTRGVEAARLEEPAVSRLVLEDPPEETWPEPPEAGAAAPLLDRPASLTERLEAGAVDFVILGSSWVSITYLAQKAARAELAALLPAWPYLVGFLAFLGLGYAAAFTGLTGQTPGKMLFGLRVVDGSGGQPGIRRAAVRALVAVVGIAALGLGVLAILIDPARRALHDRLLKTRVVRV